MIWKKTFFQNCKNNCNSKFRFEMEIGMYIEHDSTFIKMMSWSPQIASNLAADKNPQPLLSN